MDIFHNKENSMCKIKNIKHKKFVLPVILFVLVITGGYCFKNIYYRTAIIRTFAKGSWYIDSEEDTVYTMGYYGIQKYLYQGKEKLSLIAENDKFCKNTLIARSAVIGKDYVYVIARSYLGGITETGEKDYHNGAIIVMRKNDLAIIRDIPADIKYVEGKIVKNKLVISGIMGYDIYDVTNREYPVLAYKHRTPQRSEFQGCDTFTKDSMDYVVFSLLRQNVVSEEHYSYKDDGACWLEPLGRRVLIQSLNDYLDEVIENKGTQRSRLTRISLYAQSLAQVFKKYA